jgi:hypothetical protein
MLGLQGLEIGLGPWTQLGDHLAGAERAEPPTGIDRLTLAVGMQESGGIEIAGTGGVHQLPQVERGDGVRS